MANQFTAFWSSTFPLKQILYNSLHGTYRREIISYICPESVLFLQEYMENSSILPLEGVDTSLICFHIKLLFADESKVVMQQICLKCWSCTKNTVHMWQIIWLNPSVWYAVCFLDKWIYTSYKKRQLQLECCHLKIILCWHAFIDY